MNEDELWDAVVGQPEAVALLREAATAPVHAYMFVGSPGTGRMEAARALAGSLFAGVVDDPSSTGANRHRRLAVKGSHPDLVLIQPGGRTLRVDETAAITREGSRSPLEAGRKVIVVDRFETAEPEAAASLLKTIEEPPASTVFILLAEEVLEEHVTVLSRCVRVDFPPLSDEVVTQVLLADSVPEELAPVLATASGGRLDRARLLAADPAFIGRRNTWRSVPDRLDGTGAAVAVVVSELQEMINDSQTPLTDLHEVEMKDLAEREKTLGARGSGRSQLVERQRREARRLRDDEIRFGFATLSRRYLEWASNGSSDGAGGVGLEATARITEAAGELVRNPNESLLLQALFLDLPAIRGHPPSS